MIEFERKIGPKGQIVIPKEIRRALKLKPKSKVLISLKENELIVKSEIKNPVKLLREIAKKGKSIENIDMDSLYDEEMQKTCVR